MFIVVGERINTTRKKVQAAVAEKNAAYIQGDVKKQQAAGARYIDVNAGARVGHEMEDMRWLVETILEVVEVPLCLDSPDPKVLEMAFGLVDKPPIINSISLERVRYDSMLGFLKGKDCSILALCLDDSGMPTSASEVIERAERLVSGLTGIGFSRERIYVDPLVQPVGTNSDNAVMVMDALRGIKSKLEGVRTNCGLSNVSFGLPTRKRINRTFLTLMMAAGLDAAILDPLDLEIMATIRTTELLLGKDRFCRNFLKAYRAGEIPG